VPKKDCVPGNGIEEREAVLGFGSADLTVIFMGRK
jgi:hypothetical protein